MDARKRGLIMTNHRLVSTCRSILLTAILLMLLTSCDLGSPGAAILERARPTPNSSRKVVSSALGWQELWRRQMLLSYGQLPLALSGKDKLILPINNGATGLLTALNPHNGQEIWSQEFISPYRGDAYTVDSILADGEQIYIATPYVIKAFRAVDGQPQWTTTDLQGHTSYVIVPSRRSGLIRLRGGGGYYVDKRNGAVSLAERGVDEQGIEIDKLTCQIDLKFSFACTDIETHRPVWQISLGWPMRDAQLVDSRVMVVSAGNGYRNLLAGIDQTSGQILWSQPDRDIVSNFVVVNGAVYALTANSAMVQYDAITGNEIGRMEFSGESLDTDLGNQYWLLATDTEIFVYLGDSQELIAFSIK
jgi:hypothetical protein